MAAISLHIRFKSFIILMTIIAFLDQIITQKEKV